MSERLYPVTQIQRFCMHDGPGVRTTVFFKGCPLRCAWCHNPETQSAAQQILFYPQKCVGCGACVANCPKSAHKTGASGAHILDRALCVACGKCAATCPSGALETAKKDMTLDELLAEIEKDRVFYGETGGLTLSGGEPMAHPEEALALLEACHARGIGTAVETCGFFPSHYLPRLARAADLLLFDVKDTNEERHFRNTGAPLAPILANLREADRLGIPTRLRCILVAGENTEPAHYDAIAALGASLSHCTGVDWLPYHAYGGSKAAAIGREDNGRREWIPTAAQLAEAKERGRF